MAKDLQMANGIAHAIAWLAVLSEKTKNINEAEQLATEAKNRFTSHNMRSHEKEMEELISRINDTKKLQ